MKPYKTHVCMVRIHMNSIYFAGQKPTQPMAMAIVQVLSPAPLMKPLSDCPGQQLVEIHPGTIMNYRTNLHITV